MKKIKQFVMQLLNVKSKIINSFIEISCYLCSIIFLILGFLVHSSEDRYLVLLFLSILIFIIGFRTSHDVMIFRAVMDEVMRFTLSLIAFLITIKLIGLIIVEKDVILTIVYGLMLLIPALFCFLYIISRIFYIKKFIKSYFHKSEIIIPSSQTHSKPSFKIIIDSIISFLLAVTTIISAIVNILNS